MMDSSTTTAPTVTGSEGDTDMTKYIDPADDNTTPRRAGRLEEADVEGHRFHSFANDGSTPDDTEGHARRTILDDAEADARRNLIADADTDDTEGHGRRRP